jgi:hypothetical protein
MLETIIIVGAHVQPINRKLFSVDSPTINVNINLKMHQNPSLLTSMAEVLSSRSDN